MTKRIIKHTFDSLTKLAYEKLNCKFASVEKNIVDDKNIVSNKFALYVNYKDEDNKVKMLVNSKQFLFDSKQDIYDYLINFKGDTK